LVFCIAWPFKSAVYGVAAGRAQASQNEGATPPVEGSVAI